MAALFGYSAIVDLLVVRGSDRYVEDAAGNSAVSMARTQNKASMVAQLNVKCRIGA